MAITDFPKIPGELSARIGELNKKIKDGTISIERVKDNALLAMGKLRIDKTGMKTIGDFGKIEFDINDLKALMDSLENLIDFLYILYGKSFYVKTGEKIEKISLSIPFKPKAVNDIPEKDEEEVPVVEFKPDENGKYPEKRLHLVIDFFKKRFGDRVNVPNPGFVIHQYEGFAGWLKDYKEFTKGMDILIPLLELTTKKKIIKNGESALLLIGDVLTRCGV